LTNIHLLKVLSYHQKIEKLICNKTICFSSKLHRSFSLFGYSLADKTKPCSSRYVPKIFAAAGADL